jgi:desulfoferrodoxin-like iron-binding protein
MNALPATAGVVYFCPVCGAEILVVGGHGCCFTPRCCNRDMVIKPHRTIIYTCPVCGSQVAVVRPGNGVFVPRCCNRPMLRQAE